MSVKTSMIAAGVSGAIAEKEAPLAEAAMVEFDITKQARAQMFLAQVLHESGGLQFFQEIWGPTADQRRYDTHPGLGNKQPGDGKRYMGRGPIQLTGRANYAEVGPKLKLDLVNHPELASDHKHGWRIAAYFFQSRGCNEIADRNDFIGVTKKINPPCKGLAERQRYLQKLHGQDCLPTDRWAHYSPAEQRWITEYDTTRSPERRRVLRRVMTEQRKRIFAAAKQSGWNVANRLARWRSLRSRTQA